jgi:sugar lactone lactonase YvrE
MDIRAFCCLAGWISQAGCADYAGGASVQGGPARPALDAIVSSDAKIEILGEHFGLTEGPVSIRQGNGGYLLFSDCAANVIYKWQEGAPLSVYLERSGYTGRDVLNVGQQTVAGRLAILLIGSNGLTLDPQGRLYVTGGFGKTFRYDVQPDGTIANRTIVYRGGKRRHEDRPAGQSFRR